MDFPKSLNDELRSFIAEIETCQNLSRDPALATQSAPGVSGWSVAHHLEHLAAADAEILEWLHQSASGAGTAKQGRANLLGRIVLFSGKIPRGKGKAPEGFRPRGCSVDELQDKLDRVFSLANGLRDSTDNVGASRATKRHFVFGHLNPYQWIRLGHIHHKHHRRIIEDILKQLG